MRVSNGQSNAAAIAAHLDKVARQVRDVLWRMEDPVRGILKDPDLEQELVYFVKQLYTQTMIALDHLGLAGSRADLARAWDSFVKSGLEKVTFYPEPGAVGSEVYDYLDAVIDGLRAIEPRSAEDRDSRPELLQLEKLLNRTAYILQKRSVVPSKEKDVHDVMDEYLEAIYGADYCREFSIPGTVKNFRPDSGIRSLGAVIEFKFAKDPQGLKTATSGLFEDAAGYKASADWKKYYSVIYMTGAHGTAEQLLAAFEQAGMIDWTPILVTGTGARAPKPKRRPTGAKTS
jgi:hypothetical protein